ncbi:unnamed protein product [Tenebrio molitor]|nr:unnamed protein product [Tenebrio molitor]
MREFDFFWQKSKACTVDLCQNKISFVKTASCLIY